VELIASYVVGPQAMQAVLNDGEEVCVVRSPHLARYTTLLEPVKILLAIW
jgi:hypothetical protein